MFSLLCCFNLFSWDFNSPPPKFLLKVILPKIKIKKAASYPFFFFFFIPNGKLVKSQIKKQISMYSKKSLWKFSSERRRANVHHLTFRKQFMLLRYRRHINYLIFLPLFLAAEYHSSLQLGNWQAQCHQEEQPHVPLTCCLSHLFFVLARLFVKLYDGWSKDAGFRCDA